MLLLIPLLPFLGFLVNAAFGRRLAKSTSGGVACLAIIASFVVAAAFQLMAVPFLIGSRRQGAAADTAIDTTAPVVGVFSDGSLR